MEKYNLKYLQTHYSLIKCFLFDADRNIVDISYSVDGKRLCIQTVLLTGSQLSKERIENVKSVFFDFEVVFIELFVTETQFNNYESGWQPQSYTWLDYLLFSKAQTS